MAAVWSQRSLQNERSMWPKSVEMPMLPIRGTGLTHTSEEVAALLKAGSWEMAEDAAKSQHRSTSIFELSLGPNLRKSSRTS